MLAGKNVVFGVTGCIAIYKSLDVVSRLRKLGANVYVIMTKNATRLVAPITFRTISDNPVVVEMFEEPRVWNVEHIALAERADLFMVCPATANAIAKVRAGIADDFLSTTILATTAPRFFVPAMNNNMYENPITTQNIEYLKSLGYHFMEPDTGRLASGKTGKGRMPEASRIVDLAVQILQTERILSGIRVLVTAGPTVEPIDPVRYLSNHSSGKMGYAVAEVAAQMGAEVTLVSGPVGLPVPPKVTVHSVHTGLQMRDKVSELFSQTNILIGAAAVSDYRPEIVSEEKIKKSGDSIDMRFLKNPDILAEMGRRKAVGQTIIGFAAETENMLANAAQKAVAKNADMIVANDVLAGVFGSDFNKVSFVFPDGRTEDIPRDTKRGVARSLLERALWLHRCKNDDAVD